MYKITEQTERLWMRAILLQVWAHALFKTYINKSPTKGEENWFLRQNWFPRGRSISGYKEHSFNQGQNIHKHFWTRQCGAQWFQSTLQREKNNNNNNRVSLPFSWISSNKIGEYTFEGTSVSAILGFSSVFFFSPVT